MTLFTETLYDEKLNFFEQHAVQLGGTMGVLLTCTTCGNERAMDRHEDFVTLCISARDGHCTDLVQQSFLARSVRVHCGAAECGKNRKHTTRHFAEIWGTHVLVQVKRFSGDGSKIHTTVTFTQEMCFDGENFVLDAVVEHVGRDVDSGHYKCYGRCGARWYCCNDYSVRQVSWEAVRTVQAYALFLKRV